METKHEKETREHAKETASPRGILWIGGTCENVLWANADPQGIRVDEAQQAVS